MPVEANPRGCDGAAAPDTDENPMRQVVVPAAGMPVPYTCAPSSVWAAASAAAAALRKQGRFGEAAGFEAHPPAPVSITTAAPARPQIVASAGFVQVSGSRYPDDRWTPERAAKELARRAKQRPPRPPKGAKTRSKKLRQLVGDDWDT